MFRPLLALLAVLGVLLPVTCHAEHPVLVADGFEAGLAGWTTTDPESAEPVWLAVETKGPADKLTQVLRVTGPSTYQPPVRSPHSIALANDVVVGDFELTVDVQNTRPDAGPHRDLCLFWGYQDASHFYYVHLGARSDPHACQIFIVNDEPRTAITKQTAKGTPWRNGWHKVKVVRRVADGAMEVYFDDLDKPLMTAEDATFAWGQVGLGTFDDHGNFDNFVLRGEQVQRPQEGAAPQ